MSIGENERRFVQQCNRFLELCPNTPGCGDTSSRHRVADRPALPLKPTIIENYHQLSSAERESIRSDYFSDEGVAYFIVLNDAGPPHTRHPLFDIAEQLRDELHLEHPLAHPLEGHPEAVARYGPADSTVKIYNLPKEGGRSGYREQAETSEMFAMHHDGLGSAGTVQTALLYCDTPPLWGGFTYFQNILRLSQELARSDMEAFRALFLPDALTILRPRGKGAIKVRTPVLFVNEERRPESFFRVASGEYTVAWRPDTPGLDRARRFLMEHAQPFAHGSSFVYLSRRGHGCLMRNEAVAHGRTEFIDSAAASSVRTLSRKWFMTTPQHAVYKHVPGMLILDEYAQLFPELFGAPVTEGEWLYDQDDDVNRRVIY